MFLVVAVDDVVVCLGFFPLNLSITEFISLKDFQGVTFMSVVPIQGYRLKPPGESFKNIYISVSHPRESQSTDLGCCFWKIFNSPGDSKG